MISILRVFPVTISLFALVGCTKTLKVNKVAEQLIFKGAPFEECHASTIVENSPGELMVSVFGGTHEGRDDVSIWLAKYQGGEWGKAEKFAEGVVNDSVRYPTWNPVLFKSDQGRLFLFYKVGPSPREWWGMVRASDDNGSTWGPAKRLPDGILGPIKNKPVQLPNGDILSPSSTEGYTPGGDLSWKIHIERSTDFGNTWELIPVDPDTKFNVIQPSILLLPDHRLQTLSRSKDDYIIQSFSEDNGSTWGPLTQTSLPNPNSGTDAVTLHNGWQMLVYNPMKMGDKTRANRSKLYVAVSKDGLTWDDVLALEDHSSGEYSYPAIIQSSDNKIHITYSDDLTNVKHVVLAIDQ